MKKTQAEATAANQSGRGRKIEVIGRVVKAKMMKTITVEVESKVRHKKYGKYLKYSTVFKAHDEKSEAKVGDLVRIFETRPLSKTKRWRLVNIVEKAKGVQE